MLRRTVTVMPNTSNRTDRSLASQLLVDRYRCDEDIASFVPINQMPEKQGFFRFGDETICYGQYAGGETHASIDGRLHDALDHVVVGDSCVSLPFDPQQVIDNLRAERYPRSGNGLRHLPGGQLLRSTYYAVRPLMPVGVRKHLQKLYFRGWQQIPFPQWPVDSTVEAIHERLLMLALKARRGQRIPFIWFWPKGALSCTIVTHDVETTVGKDTCVDLMELDESFSIKSSFQVVPEKRYSLSQKFLAQIRDRGFELNVHDLNHDGHLFRDKTEFMRRAVLINQYARSFGAAGFRSAVMYRNIDWFHALDVTYDMSVPNVSHLDPQQGGCCTVMPFFIGNIVELPVTMTQDYTLFHILGQYSTDLWLEQSRRIRDKHGLLSVIVHPDYIQTHEEVRVYRDLLAHFAELRSAGQTWIALPREVASWWRKRSELTLVRRGKSWSIDGEGKEHATLAFAVLDGDSLRYELDSE